MSRSARKDAHDTRSRHLDIHVDKDGVLSVCWSFAFLCTRGNELGHEHNQGEEREHTAVLMQNNDGVLEMHGSRR